MNGEKIDKQEYVKMLGPWLSEDIGDWEKNTTEICRKAFTRMGMLSRLEYLGVPIKDRIELYCKFILSTTSTAQKCLQPHLHVKKKENSLTLRRSC